MSDSSFQHPTSAVDAVVAAVRLHGPWQRSLRFFERVPRDRRVVWTALGAALLVTIAEWIGFGSAMHSGPLHDPLRSGPLQVRWITAMPPPESLPLPPEPEPDIIARPSAMAVDLPSIRRPPAPVVKPQADTGAMQARIGTAGIPSDAPRPRLFNADGSIRLAPEATVLRPRRESTDPIEAGKERWAEMQRRGDNPLNCTRTRFAGVFAPDESVGSRLARKYTAIVGLYDPIDRERRERRASEGCDPPPVK